MRRLLLLIVAASAAAGCQASNAFAPFGPQKVPAPATLQTPYYPPVSAAAHPANAPSERLSVSAETRPVFSSSIAKTTSEPADREPIRIVENPAAGARTATVNSRSPASVSAPPTRPLDPPPKTSAPPADPRRSGVIRQESVRQASYEQIQPAAGQWRAR